VDSGYNLTDRCCSQIKRLAGEDRYATAAQILENFTFTDPLHPQESTSYPQNIYLATGNDFPDALTEGVLAGLKGDMLVLVDSSQKTLPPAVKAYLKKLVNAKIKPNIVILGGTGVVPEDNVQEISNLFSGSNQ
jgi:hypothetical protein